MNAGRRTWARLTSRLNLRLRLALVYSAVTLALLLAFGAGLYSTLERFALSDQADLLLSNAHAVASELDLNDGQLRWHPPVASWTPGLLVALYDAEGRLIGRTPTPSRAEETLFPSQMSREAMVVGPPGVGTQQEVATDTGEWMRVTLTLAGGGGDGAAAPPEPSVVGYLQVARSLEPVESTLHRLLVLLLTLIPLAVLGAGVGGYFVATRALRPIDAMISTAERIDRENLSERLPEPPTHDEVRRLATTFNRLLGRLEEGFRRERQFTADASHELRTPTAVILAQAQATRARPRAVADYEHTLDTIIGEAEHMGRLIEQLLFLARSDAGVEVLEREPLDLAELAQSVTAQMTPSAVAAGIRLEYQSAERDVAADKATWVLGDQTRLMQVFLNLIGNAIRYCPPGSAVAVRVRALPGQQQVEAQVVDDGPGIAPEHLAHLFERFYRVDRARRRRPGPVRLRDDPASGTGLGLAITRSIVRAHGGEITVSSQVGQAPGSPHGTAFRILLPTLTGGKGVAS